MTDERDDFTVLTYAAKRTGRFYVIRYGEQYLVQYRSLALLGPAPFAECLEFLDAQPEEARAQG